jgi:hypothetical protein
MSGSGFTEISRSSEVYYAPDFSVHTERWWDDPTPPRALPSIEIVGSLLPQIVENYKGGKQTCSLTSQLNALIVRGELAPSRAAELQDQLATSSEYAGYWVPYGDGKHLGWAANPTHLAYVLNQAFNTRIGLERLDSGDIWGVLEERLRAGYAAALLGQSAIGGHTRLGFETIENPGQIFVHDPKYDDMTGLYSYEDLPSLQTADYGIVF